MSYLFHPFSPSGFIIFPFILIAVKIVGLFNPGPEWKRFTVKITSFEGDFESSLQMLLSLYIVFARAETGVLPKWWQFSQIAASLVMLTKTSIADYLTMGSPKHMVKLLVIKKGGRTTKQSMNNLWDNNIFWCIFCTILLSDQIFNRVISLWHIEITGLKIWTDSRMVQKMNQKMLLYNKLSIDCFVVLPPF